MSEAKAKLKSGSKRFSKFSVVGLSNAVIDIGVLNLFLWLEPTREVSLLVLYNGVALVLANLNSYFWNTLWTFRGRAEHDVWQIVLFAAGPRQHRDQQRTVLGAGSSGHRVYRRTDVSRRQRRQDHLRNGGIDHQLFHHALRGFLAPALVERSLVRAQGPC
jgi:hypothetical protein